MAEEERLNCVLSPSTRYRELAIGPSLFHWESHEGERIWFVPEWRFAGGGCTGQLHLHLKSFFWCFAATRFARNGPTLGQRPEACARPSAKGRSAHDEQL